MPTGQNVSTLSGAWQESDQEPLISLLRQAGINPRTLAGYLHVHPRTIRRWGAGPPDKVRWYLEELIRNRQLKAELARLQALLSDRSQAIDP